MPSHFELSSLQSFDPMFWAFEAAGLIAIFAWHMSYYSHYQRKRRPDTGALYENQDGSATSESYQKYSRPKLLTVVIAILIAELILLISSLILTLAFIPDGLVFVYSIAIILCSAALAHSVWSRIHSRPNPGTASIIYGLFTSALLFVTSCRIFLNTWNGEIHPTWRRVVFILAIAQLIGTSLVSIFQFFLPRRPDIYIDGNPVDRQDSSSLWSFVTFSWAGDTLAYVSQGHSLQCHDLPRLPYRNQSSKLQAELEERLYTRRLLTALFSVHWTALLLQQLLTVASVGLGFAPQFCLYNILKSLEAISLGERPRSDALYWVIGLGSFMIVGSVVESRLYWHVMSRVAIPMYEQLSATIYAKALRAMGLNEEEPKNGSNQKDSEESRRIRTGHNVTSLMTVDAKRVSDQAAYSYIMVSIFLKFGFACLFLVFLLGWTSALAGLCAAIVISPASIHVSKRYKHSQKILMQRRDKRIATIKQILRAIRDIKLGAHEDLWHAETSKIRRMELQAQWTCFLYDIGLLFLCTLSPVLLSIVSLGTYAYVHETLTPSVAFTAIAAFGSVEISVANLPEMVTSMMEAYVSLERIDRFLASEEPLSSTLPSADGRVSFDNATIAYRNTDPGPSSTRFVLHQFSVSFPSNSLSVISGRSGSGKSLILASILGESEVLSGTVRTPRQDPAVTCVPDEKATLASWVVRHRIGVVPQDPWIENGTVMDNILFGLPYIRDRYLQVLSDCGLDVDVATFPARDRSHIGPGGIRLSGGQRWRIALARVLYSRAGILLFDDILSAVDVHTARHLCARAISGALSSGRTRILVTHHVDMCAPYAQYLVNLKESGVVESSDSEPTTPNEDQENLSITSSLHADALLTGGKYIGQASLTRTNTTLLQETDFKQEAETLENDTRGAVRLGTYLRYFRSGGHKTVWFFILLFYTSFMGLNLARPWWVNVFTKTLAASKQVNSQREHLEKDKNDATHEIALFLFGYIILSALSCAAGSIRYYFVLSASIRTSRSLFEGLLFTVLHAPMQWLDSVPTGRILNRFAADMALVDSKLGNDFGALLHRLFEVVGIVASGLFVSPITFVFSLVPVSGASYYASQYLSAARQIKRLEGAARSPVLEHLGSSMAGLSTIRVFSREPHYLSRMHDLLDQQGQAIWHLWLFNRWFNLRVTFTGIIYCIMTSALVVLLRHVDASMVGFVLSFVIQYPAAILWSVRQYTNVELSMTSVERILEYESMGVEKQEGEEADPSWPDKGHLEVRNLSVGYGNLPPVLKEMNFLIEAGQRIGVVGRTGAGKSTLSLALFRFLEARTGSILIDGIDISTLKLSSLRSRLHIIAQDPVLYSGTVRSNLDPYGRFTDHQLRKALVRLDIVEMEHLEMIPGQEEEGGGGAHDWLSMPISEGGSNLSTGQRQLISLCRAFLSQPKVLVLDEATSGIDRDSDSRIQRAIRNETARCGTTLIVIAHRLSTIIDFDAIMVVDSGTVVEIGAASTLMDITGGIFRSLVEQAPDREALVDGISCR